MRRSAPNHTAGPRERKLIDSSRAQFTIAAQHFGAYNPLTPYMPLASGARFGVYEVVSLLGAGGMGEVYLGRDAKLNRRVAIKVLRSASVDPADRRRFQREAQLASSLNHPHILTVYDAGEIDDQQYLVTEYIDGTTLRDWANATAHSPEEIAELLIGVGDGLAAAHAAGIVHRDIKPGNILVARNGYAKLIDFGVATLDRQLTLAESSPTTAVITESRVIVGTVPYMSPEQVAGKPLDARSDVFSFGVVLYELVGGRHPFAGSSDLQMLERILHGNQPPLPDAVPEELRRLITRALERDPDRRYQSMADLVADLRGARLPATTSTSRRIARDRTRGRLIVAAVAAAATIAAGLITWRLWEEDFFWRNPIENVVVQKLTDFPGDEIDAAISPDGRFTAFLSDRDGRFETWIAPTGSGEFVNVTKGRFPAFYPGPIRYTGFSGDSGQLWFLEQVSLRPQRLRPWVTSVVASDPHPFLDIGMNPAWSPDGGSIVYHTPEEGDPIFIADRTGNNARQVHVGEPGTHNHFLTWSPDGRFIYFVKGVVTTDELDLWRFAVPAPQETARPERITTHNSRVAYPSWLDGRTLIYSATAPDGAGQWLYAMDTRRRIPHRVSSGIGEQYLSVATTADARRLVVTVALPKASLWRVPVTNDVQGESAVQPFTAPNARSLAPRFGPDYVLFLSSKSGADGLWSMAGSTARELWKGSDGGLVAAAAVSRDGTQIAFAYRTAGRSRLAVMNANGTNIRTLTEALDLRGSFSWSPDGKWIAFAGAAENQPTRVYKIALADGALVPLAGPLSSRPMWSPDGRFIVYSEPVQAGRMRAKAVTPEGQAFPIPEIWINYQTGTPYRFLTKSNALIYLKEGNVRNQNFFLVDLTTGQERQLTDLQSGFEIRDFDIDPDGHQILFDRQRDNADVVMLERR
jgi:serine/threonine protein kinase/Tol biopolymer transport system component